MLEEENMNIDMYFIIVLSTFIVGIESLILFLQYTSIKEKEEKSSLFWWTLSSLFYQIGRASCRERVSSPV